MKSIILTCLIIVLLLPVVLVAEVTYLSESEYKRLSRQERRVYWDNLESELLSLQQRKADAIALNERNLQDIERLRNQIREVDSQYDMVYNNIVNGLNLSRNDIESARRQIAEFKRKIDNWNSMSDSELWNHVKGIRQTINDYNAWKKTQVAKAPDFRNDIIELDRKIVNLENTLQRIRPRYYEDSYTVVRGDYLSKIAGYSFIYNDSSKWGIIFRANRDQIKDPNLIYVDQVLRIPRGLPDTWKVYRGESLWRISSYPEVYGKGTEWPKIYRANQDQIKNPDLIFPNQILRIPRD